ncbi:MAG: MarR family transcriptional regulator [Solirubrobacterales bacterium]|nr:MarR family transcriptional regulator [Solirubrobacterales bacterium]
MTATVDADADYSLAADLRLVLGRLVRMLRSEHRLGLTQAAVLGRLDRDGDQGTGELARFESVRPQSMSQTVVELETAGLVTRKRDQRDGRRILVSLTDAGRSAIELDRGVRDGRLAAAIQTKLSDADRAVLREAVAVLSRLCED